MRSSVDSSRPGSGVVSTRSGDAHRRGGTGSSSGSLSDERRRHRSLSNQKTTSGSSIGGNRAMSKREATRVRHLISALSQLTCAFCGFCPAGGRCFRPAIESIRSDHNWGPRHPGEKFPLLRYVIIISSLLPLATPSARFDDRIFAVDSR